MTRPRSLRALILCSLALAGSALWASPPGAEPAATLLLPYFEVHPHDPEAQTTLLAVGNAGSEPAVAHVVTWTDWGIPTYSFDLVLGPDQVATVNLRDLFVTGSLPVTDGSSVIGCDDRVEAPRLDPPALEVLRARHAGLPDPQDGLCYGSERGDDGTLVGYLTVDVVRRCAKGVYFPTQLHYFDAVEQPPVPIPPALTRFAADDNVLWGDVLYVSGRESSAHGLQLVHVPFDAEAAAAGKTFYRRYTVEAGADGRSPLGSRYRGRFIRGGAVDGGTDLLVWLESPVPSEPRACGEVPVQAGCQQLVVDLYDEEGRLLTATEGGASDRILRLPPGLAFRLAVGSDQLPVSEVAGTFDLRNEVSPDCGVPAVLTPPSARGTSGGLQAWVIPVLAAQGRFSVGLQSTRLPMPE